jgi:hypothetical protein
MNLFGSKGEIYTVCDDDDLDASKKRMNEIKTTIFINVVEKLKAYYKVELGELRKKRNLH